MKCSSPEARSGYDSRSGYEYRYEERTAVTPQAAERRGGYDSRSRYAVAAERESGSNAYRYDEERERLAVTHLPASPRHGSRYGEDDWRLGLQVAMWLELKIVSAHCCPALGGTVVRTQDCVSALSRCVPPDTTASCSASHHCLTPLPPAPGVHCAGSPRRTPQPPVPPHTTAS